MSDQRRASQQRLAQFEAFEQRLMMTADPVGSLLPPLDLSLPRVEQVQVAEVASEFPAAEFDVADMQTLAADQPTEEVSFSPSVDTITQLAQLSNNPATAAAETAAAFGFDGTGQTVAVIDTGIAWDHNALGGAFGTGSRVVGGWDFAENDADPYDDGPAGFHGTHVAGIIGSSDETNSGVSPGVDLVGLRVFDDAGASDLKWVEQALRWVHEHRNDFASPITTVNLSLGTTWNSENTPDWGTLEDELALLKADGLFISVAAGNSFEDFNTPGLSYPASSEHVVPVGSHDANGQLSDFSQRTERILAAPGESIKSTIPNFIFGGTRDDSFIGSSGTSMAAPYVAGAAAVLRQAYESIGVTEIDQDLIYQQFRETATQIYDSVTQNYYSQIDLQAAIESVLAQKPTVEEGNEETSAGENQKPESTPPTATTPEAPVEELTPSPTPEPTPAPTPEPTPEPVPQPAPEPAPAPVSGWLVDGVLSVEGTAGDDLITVDASGERFTTVTVNGASQQFEQSDIDRIEIKAGAGNDKLQINLGTTDDSVVVSEGQVLVSNDLYELDATDFATIDVHNSGGTSKLTLQDSVGDDAVHIDAAQRSGSIEMAGFGATGTGFTKVVTTSTGGNDSLTMEGTSERERFVARDARSVMRAKDFVAKGLNFESVQFVGNGGLDRAILRGTGQHDIFELSPEHATVTSVDSTVTVTDVSNIRVINRAETGESGDEVRFIGSAGDDVFVSKGERSVMRGDGYKNVARGVQTIYVDTGAGNDQASIIGSEGDDSLRVDRSTIEFESTRNLLRLVNAEVVDFAGNGGLDQIAFEEFEALDLLESLGDQATAYLRDRTISATDFDVLEAETVDEAIAEYDLEAVDYLYMLRGNWQSR